MKKIYDRRGRKLPWLKFDLKMKLTTLFTIASFFTMMANTGYTQTISLDVENATVSQVIDKIEATTEYRFVYNTKFVDLKRKVSIKAKNVSIENVLSDLFGNTSTSYKIRNTQIVLKDKKEAVYKPIVQPLQIDVKAQKHIVTGTVTDANGQPLIGANIIEKGTSNGAQSDFDGKFSLAVASPNAILVVSYLGFVTKEIAVNNQKTITVTLIEDASELDEVVVVGYGTIKKSDVTGAVVSIGNTELTKVGATSPMQALQANAAGVNISQRTGSVGASFDITIRGTNSFADQQPLYVVDGIVTESIDFLNPQDIQRIDILKDASSTAIYGSRGSNGVVIVTTKSGEGFQNRKPSISYSGYVGIRDVANMPDFFNSYDESVLWNRDRQVARDLVQGNTIVNSPTYGFPNVIVNGTNYWEEHLANRNGTDWLGEFLKSSTQQNHFISANGGSENVSYVVGFGYQGDDGNAVGQYYKKYNFKASIDAKVSDQFSIGANINLAFSEQELISRQGYTQQLFRMPSYAPSHNADGSIIQSPMLGISSNVSPYTFANGNSAWNVEQYNIVSNFYLKFSPIKEFSFKSTFSPNARIQRDGEYKDRFATRSISIARFWTNNRLSYVWDNQMNFTKEFGDHNISYDFIQSATFDRSERSFSYGRDVPFKSSFYNVQSAPQRDAESGYNKSTLLSFTNRVNYSFKDRYLLTGTMRWDGASRLADGKKWSSFPSVAAAWKMNEESFLKDVSEIDNLKVRISYGYTGGYGPINTYATQSSLNRQKYYDWDGVAANGFVPSDLANKELTWERTREWNFGTDFGLLNNRVSGEINVYDRLSKGTILNRKLAMPTGWPSMFDNIASISNKGIEIQLKTVNIEQGDFKWETNFIFSKNTNKIVDLYGEKLDDVPNRWFIGQPVDVIYAMVFDGVWQKDELAPADQQALEGTAKVKDLNGDGSIDIDNDMKVLGSPAPNWIGTFSTTFTYKNWDLSATIFTKQGSLVYSPFHREFTDFNSKVILDVPYYVRENPVTESRFSNTYPQASYQGQYWGEDADDFGYPGFNKDASFVRVQNITLGYNFGSNFLSKAGISSLRLYVNALNPFTFTKYEGFDPEWAGAEMSGVDANNSGYSIYQLGVNVKF